MCVIVMCYLIHLSDLHCPLHCPHHHPVIAWLDLHLETYQHEPFVYPGNQKTRKQKNVFNKIHSFIQSYNSLKTACN